MVLQVPQIPIDRTQPLPEDQGAICQTCVICGRVYRTCFPNSPAICHQQPPNRGTSPARLIRARQGTFFLFRMIQLSRHFFRWYNWWPTARNQHIGESRVKRSPRSLVSVRPSRQKDLSATHRKGKTSQFTGRHAANTLW